MIKKISLFIKQSGNTHVSNRQSKQETTILVYMLILSMATLKHSLLSIKYLRFYALFEFKHTDSRSTIQIKLKRYMGTRPDKIVVVPVIQPILLLTSIQNLLTSNSKV